MPDKKLICPCCEQHYFSKPDSFEGCPVCRWQDDMVQRDDPDFAGGANDLSLNEARANYKKFGWMYARPIDKTFPNVG